MDHKRKEASVVLTNHTIMNILDIKVFRLDKCAELTTKRL